MEEHNNLVIVAKQINEILNKKYFEKIKSYLVFPSILSLKFEDIRDAKNIYELNPKDKIQYTGLYTYHYTGILAYGKHCKGNNSQIDCISYKLSVLYEKIIEGINKKQTKCILFIDRKTYFMLKEEQEKEQEFKIQMKNRDETYNILKITKFE